MRLPFVFIASLCASAAFASDGDKVSFADAAQRAVRESSLTLPAGKPFHLRASIAEAGEPGSDYRAKIEEYWVSPSKWRRTIESPNFSQTLVVNGEAVYEKDDGDYFPFWLSEFLTALFDPLPMLDTLRAGNAKILKATWSPDSTICSDFQARIDRWVICINTSHNQLSSVFTKGYGAEFKEYKRFAGKHVPRRIVTYPKPGTTIEARITELVELSEPDEQMFAVNQPTPPAERVRSLRIDDETLRKLVIGSTEIDWPSVGSGLAAGGCAVYISADRTGTIREVWPSGCDNAGLQDPLREAVKKWHLKPATSNGSPVQIEALLGFTFHTTMDGLKGLPELSDAEARQLATQVVEPVFPHGTVPSGLEITVQIAVDETGKLTGVNNTHNFEARIFLAANAALRKWIFRPYIKDGKPQYFHANIVFHIK